MRTADYIMFIVIIKGMLLLGVGAHNRALYIHPELLGALENGAGQTRLEIFGTVTEVSFCGAHVGGVGHGVFTAFGKSENAVGKLFLLFVAYTVVHCDKKFRG